MITFSYILAIISLISNSRLIDICIHILLIDICIQELPIVKKRMGNQHLENWHRTLLALFKQNYVIVVYFWYDEMV